MGRVASLISVVLRQRLKKSWRMRGWGKDRYQYIPIPWDGVLRRTPLFVRVLLGIQQARELIPWNLVSSHIRPSRGMAI